MILLVFFFFFFTHFYLIFRSVRPAAQSPSRSAVVHIALQTFISAQIPLSSLSALTSYESAVWLVGVVVLVVVGVSVCVSGLGQR